MKNFLQTKKILMASLVCVLAIFGTIGIAPSVAESTLEDLIYNRVYGTFVPDNFYDDAATDVDDWEVVGSLKTTDIIVDYSAWNDYNEDGFVDLNDVYSREDYQFKFLMRSHTLPILSTGNNDYYMVKLSHFTQVDQVIASIYIANNNNDAELKDISQYFYDRDTHILYLAPGLMYEIDNGIELKAQTVAIVHNIDDFTKEFAVATMLNPDCGKTPIDNAIPNGIQKRSFKRWLMDGLDLALIGPEHLAYVSDNSLRVYVNERLYTDWQYDATTGILSFPNTTPDDINNIAIYIEALNNVSFADTLLQYSQNQWGTTAQAITFESLPENTLCQHITYTKAPQLGHTEALDFYAFAHNDIPTAAGTSTTFNINNLQVTGITVFDGVQGAVSREDILRALKSAYGTQTVSWKPDTGTTSLANDVLSLWKPFDADKTDAKDLFSKLHKMCINYSAASGVASPYLDAVYGELQQMEVYAPNNTDGQLLDSWQYWREGTNQYTDQRTVGMYVVGKTNATNQLLGGIVDKGFPFFTVSSCNIHVPTNSNSNYNPIPTITKYDTHQTMISIIGKSDKHLYVCIAPLSLKETDSFAYERLCGFTKIRYTYVGRGNITFIKTDVHKSWLGGAEYEIYKANNSGGSLTNPSLVNYFDYFNDTDYIPKEDALPQGNTITTSSTAAVKISLPYNADNEVYYFLEKTPPVGYTRDTAKWVFSVTATSPEAVVQAEDYKQDGIITLSVYDATTRDTGNGRTEVGLGGIPFTLIDSSGQPANGYNSHDELITTYDRAVTDDNGKIVFAVRPGTYYIRQLDTIENYYMDNHEINAPGVPLDENCNYIEVVVTADRSGDHIPISVSHYEKRQEVLLQTQIYDERIGNKTPPQLGGTGSGEVETINSEWELYVLSGTPLVGYKYDGSSVFISNASGPLHVSSIYHQAPNDPTVAYAGGGSNNPGTSAHLTYISATHVEVDGVWYPLPNGSYYWKLKQASKGYVTTENRKTDLNAKWTEENKENKYKVVMDATDESILSYVVMDRQQSNMTVYSKSYDKTVEAGAFNYTNVTPKYDAYGWDDTINIFDKINYSILTDSTHSQIQSASVEKIQYSGETNAEIYAKKFSLYNSTQTNGTANLIKDTRPRAIYQLQNITDIVSMDGGVIPANSILGRYISDDKGYIFIDTFGSEQIINPNVTSQDLNSIFERVGVIDTLGRGVNGTELPNGDYILSVITAPDEYEIETMFEHTPIYQTWTKTDSRFDLLKKVNTVPFYHARNTLGPNKLDGEFIENTGTYLAASPIDESPEDPYDPRNPDQPDVSPDDSDDIPCPDDIAWIIRHRNDRTYRTIDRNNFAETQDIVPTTMAMAYTDSTTTTWDSQYLLYMFYEITEDEYNTAQNAYLAAGYSRNQWERNWEYRRQAFGGEVLYFRRFAITAAGNAAILSQNFAFNTTKPTWLGQDELTRNTTMSAAIDNTSWLNMKMATPEFQGAYHIGFGVLTVRETHNPLSNIMLRKEEFSDSLAIMAIRNRQLFNLD